MSECLNLGLTMFVWVGRKKPRKRPRLVRAGVEGLNDLDGLWPDDRDRGLLAFLYMCTSGFTVSNDVNFSLAVRSCDAIEDRCSLELHYYRHHSWPGLESLHRISLYVYTVENFGTSTALLNS